jgi:hypothetical protein
VKARVGPTAGIGPEVSGHLDDDPHEDSIDPAQDRRPSSLLGRHGQGHDVPTEVLDRHVAVMRRLSRTSLDLTQSSPGTA